MDFTKRVQAFISLGEFLSQFKEKGIEKTENPLNDVFFEAFKNLITRAQESNGWFTPDNVLFATESWAKSLTEDTLKSWLNPYHMENTTGGKTVGLIAAGNIPLVGFHDVICVLLSGHNLQLKLSKKDHQLMFFLIQLLMVIEPEFKTKISITEGNLENFDAVIATGSGNTARYFEYYFGKYPNIIRKNRNSVALLTGDETEDEMKAMADDVFRYFGLGCRNVSKVFIPKDYALEHIFKGLYHYKDIINNNKYENNFDYNKAVFMMSKFPLMENGFIMMKEDSSYSSPIGSIFYERYDNLEDVKQVIARDAEMIQCIVAKNGLIENNVKFGQSQSPSLGDYADGVDTIQFLMSI